LIRIQEGKNDPQKVKSKEFIFRMFSFEGQKLLLQLGHSSWRPRDKCTAIFFLLKIMIILKLVKLLRFMVMKFLDPVPDIETMRIHNNDETKDAGMWAQTSFFYTQIRLFKNSSKRASVSDLHRSQYGSGSSNLPQLDPPETDPDPGLSLIFTFVFFHFFNL
jgi:hypothetical protein